ncbi:MAG: hypothetical protein FVQ84_21075 [Planctomycetes bacterium]|nr:hypothetical protein [Planctomycetota bacterium]
MSKNLICLVLLLAFCMVSSVQAANIIWVSGFFDDNGDGEPDDQAWVDMLEARGYTVDYTPGWEDLDDDKIAALNAADLIIVSRCSNSGDYDDGSEIAQWNSITTPIIQSSTHLIRSSRWLWFNTTSLPNLSDVVVDISAGSHPIFDGVSSPVQITDGVVGPSTFADITGVGAGNGTLLANVTETEVAWIVEWEEGVEYYPGSGQSAGGPRMFFAAGTQEGGGIGRGEYNLTPDGEKVFFNAVRYMIGGSKLVKAGNPDPADGTFTEDTWVNLSWSPGESAVSHDVYLGDNLDDVNNGAEGTFIGNQAETFIVVGFPGFPYPDGLVPGTTYYWRIDEVNDADPNSPWKGNVWSFSIPPKTAYLPDPADAAEAVGVNASLSWTGGFGAKLHTVYFGDNFDDVDNAAGGLPQGDATYSSGPLEMAKTYYWRVDEFDGFGTHKGNVWSFITEGAVGSPSPAQGAVDVTQTPVLTWVPGVFADTYDVYFGSDATSLELKGSGALGAESFEPGQLEWNTTYYWRVDEANNANADSPWTGPLWSFTTANFLIIDDFESYNDLDPAAPASNRIFNVWLDGFDNPTINGSVVGNAAPPFAEQSIVHDGSQSMPMSYDNAVGKSEATLTLTSSRDWTVNGINTLTIWFRGNAGNSAENLYAALNGNAVVNHDNPNAAQMGSWTQWNIDLQVFADQGVNLTNVNTITLGLGNKNNPVAGGSGTIYFDDIRLYALEPATP